MKIVLDKIKSEKKICYLLGDWNINLLSYESHNYTAEFVDMIYSYSFALIINRPTRITASSATLIGNIFTSNQADILSSYQGILLTDITDHFPIFHISNVETKLNEETYIIKRSYTAHSSMN